MKKKIKNRLLWKVVGGQVDVDLLVTRVVTVKFSAAILAETLTNYFQAYGPEMFEDCARRGWKSRKKLTPTEIYERELTVSWDMLIDLVESKGQLPAEIRSLNSTVNEEFYFPRGSKVEYIDLSPTEWGEILGIFIKAPSISDAAAACGPQIRDSGGNIIHTHMATVALALEMLAEDLHSGGDPITIKDIDTTIDGLRDLWQGKLSDMLRELAADVPITFRAIDGWQDSTLASMLTDRARYSSGRNRQSLLPNDSGIVIYFPALGYLVECLDYDNPNPHKSLTFSWNVGNAQVFATEDGATTLAHRLWLAGIGEFVTQKIPGLETITRGKDAGN